MKKIVLVLLCSVFVGVNAQKEMELPSELANQWLLEIEGDSVSVMEFWATFNKNNFKQEKPTKKAVTDYYELFRKFKLKVKEAEDLGLDTTQKFKKELKGYKEQLAKSYLTDKSVTEDLIKEGYERMKTEVSASHILIALKYHSLPSDTLEAYNKALKVRDLALAGENFDSLAIKYSDDPSAASNKGQLGYFSAFKMVYPFESGAYNTEKGGVSNLVRTRFGYHVLKVHDKRQTVGKIKVAHIMLVSNDDTPVEKAKLQEQKINEIYAKLKAGESFDLLAKKLSEHYSSAKKGGGLPWFEANQYDPDFEAAAYGIKENGAYTKPVRTKYGWHIIKRLDRKEIGSFDELEMEVRKKVSRSDRASKSKDAVLNKIKTKYGFKEKPKRKTLNWFYKNGDSTMVQGTWKRPDGAKLKKWLFKFGGKKYLQSDFATYVEERQMKRGSGDYRQIVNYLYNNWVEEVCFDFEKGRLPFTNKEYVRLLKEYRDGIILFELTDSRVWSKAVKDTVGLKEHYQKNLSKWMWGQRMKGELYTCTEEKYANQVKVLLDKGANMVEILEQVNKESQLKVRVENVFADTTKKAVLKNFDFKVGVSEVKKDNQTYLVIKVSEVVEAAPKELLEIKGLVAADYQEELMRAWIEALSKRYRVTLNSDSMKQLMKHAE